MQDGLDATLVLPDVGEKPSKQYRTSAHTVRQYCALPYAQRLAVDAACDAAAGLTRANYADDTSPQPYTVGRATKRCPESTFSPSQEGCRESRYPSTTAISTTSSATPTTMTTAYVHPAPSPALHTLNTPERIHHDAAHPDSLATSAVEVASPMAALTASIAEAATPAAPAAPLAHDGTVYETTDYALFHLLPENRDIDPNQVRKLVGMIQKHNLLHLRPVDVTPTMGIIDGQHRWDAARKLGLPIFYRVGQQLSEADITTLNTASKNWTGTDWLKYWSVKRKPAYVALADFIGRHPRISFSNAKIMLSGNGGGGTKADVFRAGQWDGADDEDVALAEQVADLVERIVAEVPTFKAPSHTGFVSALYHCVTSVEGFDAKEMLRTILAQPRTLVTCASHKQWVEMLGDIYNYRKNEGNRIEFK